MENSIFAKTLQTVKNKSYIPVSYSLVIVAFLFTFFEFRCSGREVLSLTGTDLMVGTEYKMPRLDMNSVANVKKVEPNIFAIIIFLTAIAGVIVYFIKLKKDYLIWMVLSVIGILNLFVLYFVAKKQAFQDFNPDVVELSAQFGYYLAILGFTFAGLLSYHFYKLFYTNHS